MSDTEENIFTFIWDMKKLFKRDYAVNTFILSQERTSFKASTHLGLVSHEKQPSFP